MATAYKRVYKPVARSDGFTLTEYGSTEIRRLNWNDGLVCTPGGSITTNDFETYQQPPNAPFDLPIGFEARHSLPYLARGILRYGSPPPCHKIVELSYVDPDDLAASSPTGSDYVILLRADVVTELSDADVIAAAAT